jgi:small subunit ribosomal protein S8
MATSDTIADMLTRIRNANRIKTPAVRVKRSRVCLGIAQVLKDEGYIRDYLSIDDANQGEIKIELKYSDEGEHVIRELRRFSKPGCRRYRGRDDLPMVCDGLGISIVSTSQGVMSDREARRRRIGGEVLCTVW